MGSPWETPQAVGTIVPPTPGSATFSPGVLRRGTNWLRRHPIVALLMLTPGIPEYLSSSSSMTGILVAPLVFLLFLAFNLGLYGPGVLLIREAAIRWRKGWGSIILLGAGYAILEEGIALSTFYNSNASVVGALGFYGHYAGVSWVWVTGLLMVHILFSISLPILLLGLSIPETKGRSLLTARQVRYALGILVLDVSLLFLIVLRGERFWMGWPIFVGSLAAIGVLVLAARWAPPTLLAARAGSPSKPPWALGALGLSLFPATLLIEGFGGALRAAPVGVILALAGLYGTSFLLARRWVGDRENEAHLIAFAAGVIGFIGFFGFVASFPYPVVVVADVAFAFLLLRLWRRYSPAVALRPPVGTGFAG